MTDQEKKFKKFVNKHMGWRWIFHRKLRNNICEALVRQSDYMKSHPMSYEEAKSPEDVAKSLAFIYQSNNELENHEFFREYALETSKDSIYHINFVHSKDIKQDKNSRRIHM